MARKLISLPISLLIALLSILFCCQGLLFSNQRIRPNHPSKIDSTLSRGPISLPDSDKKYFWVLSNVAFSLLPIAPGVRRKTLMTEVVKDTIWTLDQTQGIINVNVPVRSTIIKLKSGGLFIYNPVAPTPECVSIVRALEQEHGCVRHIVLGTLGLEHKALAGPFSQYFKTAEVWLQPGQWSFPFNIPSSLLGFPTEKRLKSIPLQADVTIGANGRFGQPSYGNANSTDSKRRGAVGSPWGDEFEFAVLGPLRFKSVGAFGETAVLHRPTQTLLVTDAVVRVADRPAPILEEDPRALLFHSRDRMLDAVEDSPEARLRGWRRMALFGLVFFPANIRVSGVVETLSKVPKLTPDVNLLGQGVIPIAGGLYAWSWPESEEHSFHALQGGLLVAPVLRKLILNREPEAVLHWADTVSSWPIKRVIPCHLENDVKASGREFRRAFDFLEVKWRGSSNSDKSGGWGVSKGIRIAQPRLWLGATGRTAAGKTSYHPPTPAEADLALLTKLSDILTKLGIVAPAKVD